MKKKILSLAMIVCMLSIAIVGGTLAYFTDTDSEENVFTIGGVEIELDETFDEDKAVLLPGTKTQNAINKDVFVKNTGESSAWVRVIVSIPSQLDVLAVEPEDYEAIAAKNILHMNTKAGVEEVWNVQKANWEAKLSDDKAYNEYTFYYNKILKAGETTEQLLDQVYLDSKVDFNGTDYIYDGNKIEQLKDGLQINVVVEAIQADGFATYEAAFAAFDAQQ